jgi:ParB/RepB/Spo0J family partition protein
MSTPAPQLSPAKVAAPVAQLLAVDQVLADPNQPRKVDEAALKELADSIRADGLLSPILVKPNGKGFYIVDGERRYRAAKLAGLKEVPVIVRADLKDQDVVALQLVANIQREDLSLPEQCDAVQRLVKKLGTARAAAEKLGKSEAWVSKRANGAALPPEIRKLMSSGLIVDIEMAVALGELKQAEASRDKEDDNYRETCFEDLVAAIKDPDPYDGPVTRDTVRDAVSEEKANQADFKKAREEAAKSAARIKAAQEAGKPIPKELREPAPYQRKVSEAERSAGRVAGDRKNLRDAAYDGLYAGLQLKGKGTFGAPVSLEYVESASDWAKFPKTSEGCHFDFNAEGDVVLLKKLASGLPGKVVVDVEPMRLSLDEVQKITDALKGCDGLKQLDLSFKHRITGQALRDCVKKLAPGQVASLPLTRADREAAKKKSNAAAATKVASTKKKKK